MNPEIESLMSQYLDGRVTAEEAAALAKILSENPEAAERFAELTRTDEGLRVALKAESRSALFTSRLRAKADSKSGAGTETDSAKRAPDRRRWLAAAAGLAVLGGSALWFSRDGTVPTVVMDWAKSRVKRNSDPGSSTVLADTLRVERPVDQAAELRRKLRGFAIPSLHMRSMALSEALNTLNRQWTDLPHKDSADAQRVKIDLASSARKEWAEGGGAEPVVTVDIPGISLHTALNLIAAQAGMKVEVSADSVSLEPEPPQAPAKADGEDRTWTFPLAKATVDTFLASIAPKPETPAPVTLGVNFTSTNDTVMGVAGVTGPMVRTETGLGSAAEGAAEAASGATGIGGTATVMSRIADAPAQADRLPALAASSDGTIHGEVITGKPVTQAGETVMADAITFYRGSALSLQASPQSDGLVSGVMMDGGAETVPASGVEAGSPPAEAGIRLTQANPSGGPVPERLTQAITFATLQAEQRDLQELSYGWLVQEGTQGGIGTQPQNVVVTGPESPELYGRRVWSGALLLNAGGSQTAGQPQPWYFNPGNVMAVPGQGEAAPSVPDNLPAWLATFGLSGEAVSHDVENGVLSITGSPAALRVASAAVAALTESAQSGVSVEMRVLDLGDLPRPDLSGGKGVGGVDPAEVEALCRKAASHPGSACVRLPVVPGVREQAVDFKIENGSAATTASQRLTAGGLARNSISGNASSVHAMALEASVTADKKGERWTVNLNIKDGNSKAEMNSKFDLMEGAWLVCEGDTQGSLYLFRLRSAALTQ